MMDEIAQAEDQVSNAVDEQKMMLMSGGQVSLPNAWSDMLLAGLHHLQSSQQLCDAAVVAGDGTTVYVHSAVMAASSATLAEYLCGHTTEDPFRSPTGHILLPLHASCGKVAESLVHFVYTGVLSSEAESILEVFDLGEKLGIRSMDTLRSHIEKGGILSSEQLILKVEDSATAKQDITEVVEETSRDCHGVPEGNVKDTAAEGSRLAHTNSLKASFTGLDQQETEGSNVQRTLRRSLRKRTSARLDNQKDECRVPEEAAESSDTRAIDSVKQYNKEVEFGSEESTKEWLAGAEELDNRTRLEYSKEALKCSGSFSVKSGKSAMPPKKKPSEGMKKSVAEASRFVKVGPWTCMYCGKTYSKRRVLKTHEIMCSGERPFPCTLCDKKYPVKWQLETHMLKHTGDRPFQCKYCGNTFTTKGAMDTHERYFCKQNRLHQDKLTCEKCNISFWSMRCLDDHQCDIAKADPAKQPGATLFQCHLCSRIFPFDQSLKIHLKTHFERPKPHACSLCDKRYSHKYLLLKHEKKHRGEKDIKCGFCPKTFYRKEDCRQHERVHTGEKPYPCSLCPKCFTSPSALKVHEKRHRKEFNYQCGTCAKGFMDSTSLRKHVSDRHMDIRPYTCMLCSKAFKRRDGLRSHYNSVHKDRAKEFVHNIQAVKTEPITCPITAAMKCVEVCNEK